MFPTGASIQSAPTTTPLHNEARVAPSQPRQASRAGLGLSRAAAHAVVRTLHERIAVVPYAVADRVHQRLVLVPRLASDIV